MNTAVLPALSASALSIKPGEYEHYKGNHYRVIGVCRNSETLEELVIYQALYADRSLWVRPTAMFCENVIVDGVSRPRFAYLHA